MTLNIDLPVTAAELKPKITVVGVGGAGGNAVNNMIQSNLGGVDFLVSNTDSQALQQSLCERRIQLGRNITQGLGAGSRPDIGRAAAEEALDEILVDLEGAHMVFVTAGMGGGTGTGAAPVIARAAREAGILTVGVITKPFHFEGVHRMRLAEEGINELTQYVDTLIIIPNQNLFRVANEKTTFADAFKMADDVLESGVRGVTDLMVHPGLINLDFADIRSVMSEMGKAMMGTGEAEGENRAIAAAEAAISNPLLDDVSMRGARGVLINITGGSDLTLFEVDEAANRIRDEVDPDANIIFGSTFDDRMEKMMRVSVVATGIDVDEMASPRPVSLSVVSGGARAMPSRDSETAPSSGAAVAQNRAVAESARFATSGATAQAIAMEPQLESQSIAEAAPVEDQPVTQPTEAESQAAPLEKAALERTPEAEAASPAVKSEPVFDPFLRGPAAQPAPQAATPESRPETQKEDRDFFAPPPPMRVESDDLRFTAARGRPEPMAEADLVNASQERPQDRPLAGRRIDSPENAGKNRESLFSRVTNSAARALQAATSGVEDSGAGRSRAPQTSQAAPAAPPPTAPTAAPARQAEAPKAAEQPRISGLEAKERARSAEVEEDMLDIPAFLRRQAN